MRISDMNWMQVEAYLHRDDRCGLPFGSTEQHAQLSLCVDAILARTSHARARAGRLCFSRVVLSGQRRVEKLRQHRGQAGHAGLATSISS